MIKEIVKDIDILRQKSEKFIPGEDDHIIADMLDTANAHKDNCVGLAAVQIGYLKRVILVQINDKFVPFINPIIIQKAGGTYATSEGCLSLDGNRTVRRHKSVRVLYTTATGTHHSAQYSGRVAQILQHEIDHLNGVLI